MIEDIEAFLFCLNFFGKAKAFAVEKNGKIKKTILKESSKFCIVAQVR